MNTNCFACRGGECIALKPTRACCDGCRFFKTKRRATTDRKRAKALIAAKPLADQKYIAGKYYQGTMPWRKEAPRRDC